MDTTRPFTYAAARAAGISRRQLASGRFMKVARGWYVEGEVGLRTRAALLLSRLPDDAHLSHASAAAMHGLWIDLVAPVHLCRGGRTRVKRPDVRSHQCPRHGRRRGERDIWSVGGLPVSSPTVCFPELADLLDLVDLVVLGDSLVAKRFVTPDQLVAIAAAFRGDGALRAREAAGLVRAGAESRQETRTRLLLCMGGLPEPIPNLPVQTPGGRRRRVDLGYPQWQVAAEYEGRQHLDDVHQWRSDIVRREEFDRLDWLLVLIESDGLYAHPQHTVDRVHAALRQHGWTGQPAPWPDFRRHFPGRTT